MIEAGELSTLQCITHTDISGFPANAGTAVNDEELYQSPIAYRKMMDVSA